jgi:hypothetical protein
MSATVRSASSLLKTRLAFTDIYVCKCAGAVRERWEAREKETRRRGRQ